MSSINNKDTSKDKLHPCCLDLNTSPSSRRKAQQTVAQRISRKRMMQPNANEQAQDGSSVVHRTGIQYGDYSSGSLSSYVQVEFLNDHDIVLAAGQDGCVDVVKLDRYMPNDCDDGWEELPRRPHRPLGTLLASNIQTTMEEPVHSLKRLQGGQAFVVGQRGGGFSVFGTEDSSSYVGQAVTRPAVQQRLPNSSALELRHRIVQRKYPVFDSYEQYYNTVDNMYMSFAIQREGPDYNKVEHYPGRPSRMFLNPRCEYAWDFREVSSSTLLASFLDREVNTISITAMDSRISPETASQSLVPKGQASNVFNKTAGHTTSSCFVSDHSFATLHMWQRPTKESSTTCIELWDIRALRNGKSICTFDVESVYDIDGNVAAADSTLDLDNQVKWADSPAQARLTPSSNDDGLFMANIVTNQGVAESYLINASRASVVKQYRTRSAIQSTNAISPSLDCLACYDTSSLSLYDFSSRDNKERGGNGSIGKKRSRDTGFSEDLDDEYCLIGTIAPKIEDEVGIRARLNCLAFNKTGTTLVGGTDAGDLFLWRGG